MAACQGHLEIFKLLYNAGCDLTEPGSIRLDGTYDLTTTNVIGIAAFDGHVEMINFVMANTNDKSLLEFKAITDHPGRKDCTHL